MPLISRALCSSFLTRCCTAWLLGKLFPFDNKLRLYNPTFSVMSHPHTDEIYIAMHQEGRVFRECPEQMLLTLAAYLAIRFARYSLYADANFFASTV